MAGERSRAPNLVARLVALGIDADDDPPPIFAPSSDGAPRSHPSSARGDWLEALLAQPIAFPIARRRALAEFERRYVATVLSRHGGNISQAAKASGLAQRYFRLVRARQK